MEGKKRGWYQKICKSPERVRPTQANTAQFHLYERPKIVKLRSRDENRVCQGLEEGKWGVLFNSSYASWMNSRALQYSTGLGGNNTVLCTNKQSRKFDLMLSVLSTKMKINQKGTRKPLAAMNMFVTLIVVMVS